MSWPPRPTAALRIIGQQPGDEGRAKKYDPAFGAVCRDLAQRGEFPEAWAAEIGVSLETIRLWVHGHPEFRDDVVAAKHLLATFWMRDLIKNRGNKDVNAAIYKLIVHRLPKLYGSNPVDLVDELLRADASGAGPIDEQTAKTVPLSDLQRRLDELRARQEG